MKGFWTARKDPAAALKYLGLWIHQEFTPIYKLSTCEFLAMFACLEDKTHPCGFPVAAFTIQITEPKISNYKADYFVLQMMKVLSVVHLSQLGASQ